MLPYAAGAHHLQVLAAYVARLRFCPTHPPFPALPRPSTASCSTQQALEEYRQLMQRLPEWGGPAPPPDHAADADALLRGAVLIARHRYPLLRHEDVAEQLDDLAVQARPPRHRYYQT